MIMNVCVRQRRCTIVRDGNFIAQVAKPRVFHNNDPLFDGEEANLEHALRNARTHHRLSHARPFAAGKSDSLNAASSLWCTPMPRAPGDAALGEPRAHQAQVPVRGMGGPTDPASSPCMHCLPQSSRDAQQRSNDEAGLNLYNGERAHMLSVMHGQQR